MKKKVTVGLTICLLVGMSIGLDAQRRNYRRRPGVGINSYGPVHSRYAVSRHNSRIIREIQRNEIRIRQLERRMHQLSYRRVHVRRSWKYNHEIAYCEREIRRLERRNNYLRSRLNGRY